MQILRTSVNYASFKNGFETNTTSFTEDIIGCGCFPCVFLCIWNSCIDEFVAIRAVFRECVYTKFAVSIWNPAYHWFIPIYCS